MSTAQIDILVQVRDQLDGLRRTREGFEEVNRASQDWLDSFRNGAAFAVATAAIDRVGEALKSVATVGIQFNSALEQARLGIAAVQKQANPAAFAKFDDALAASAAAVDLLQEKARMSPASFQQLVEGFQAITGAATGAGIPLRQQVDLVVLLSQAVAGLGLRADQFVQESRALLTGNINEDASLARMLGITKADIDRARQAGTLFDFISGKLAAFKEAGERGAGTFGTLWSNLKDALEQASATATLPAFEAIKKGLAEVSEFDWQGAGNRAAEFMTAVIEAWKQGELTQLIGLTIDAGFELGWQAAMAGLKILFSEATLNLLGQVGALIAGFIAQLNVPILTAIIWLGGQIQAVLEKVINGFKSGFFTVVNAVADKLEILLNEVLLRVNRFLGTNFQQQSLPRTSVPTLLTESQPPTLDEALQMAQESANEISQTIREMVSSNSEAYAQEGSALARLTAFVERMTAARVALKKEMPAGGGGNQAVVLLDWKKAERDAEESIRKIQEERARIEGDFTRTAAEKWHERSRLLAEEKKAIQELIAALDVRAGQETNPQVAEQIRSRADAARNKLVGVNGQIVGLGANPDDAFQQVYTKWSALMDRMGTDAANLANVVVAPFEGMFTGLSSSIEGLINQTMTWGEALLNVGRSVVSSLVKAFSDMVAQWIMSHIIMKGVSVAWHAFLQALGWEEVAQSNAQEAAKTPALLTNAWLANIGTWGTAALVGAAVVTAILAGIGAFADGGLISGPGGPREDRVLARVSPGEYIVPADAVQAIGLDNMEKIRDGQLPIMAPAASANVNVSPSQMKVLFAYNKAEMMQILEAEGADVIIERLKGRRTDLGLQG